MIDFPSIHFPYHGTDDALELDDWRAFACEHSCEFEAGVHWIDSKSSRIKYLYHSPNGGIYKCCFRCFARAKSVKKKDHIHFVDMNHAYSDFTKAREAHWKEQWIIRNKKRDAYAHILADNFYDSRPWLNVRYPVLVAHFEKYGHRCLCCKEKFVELHVDHIKPRSKFPELALDPNNLQVICKKCNLGKSNTDFTDFREKETPA